MPLFPPDGFYKLRAETGQTKLTEGTHLRAIIEGSVSSGLGFSTTYPFQPREKRPPHRQTLNRQIQPYAPETRRPFVRTEYRSESCLHHRCSK